MASPSTLPFLERSAPRARVEGIPEARLVSADGSTQVIVIESDSAFTPGQLGQAAEYSFDYRLQQ